MRKTLSVGMAAITAAVGVLSAIPAEARDYGRYGYYDGRYYGHRHYRNNSDDALAAGVVGLALGAALASGSNNRSYYRGGYYDSPRYYRGPRYRSYDYGYYEPRPYYRETCRTVSTWDPYYGRVYDRQCW